MKVLVIAFTLIFVLSIPVQPIYAPPSVNPDWQDYPYCPGGCSQEFLIEEWKEYYDIKGKEWMEQKKQELDSVISNGTLKEWIESDPSKANANVYQYYWTQGEIPNVEGEYIGTIPSCENSESIHPEDLCHVDATPPCPEPTFRKNGLCVIEKMNSADYTSEGLTDEDICGKGTVLIDGVCQLATTETEDTYMQDCLIATASYGSELAPQVQMLREIRDNTLLNTQSGKIFMNGFNTIYYSFSPTIAQLENDNDTFKETVKIFITPMIAALSIMTLADDSEFDVILYGMSTLGIIVGMYVVAPIVGIRKVRIHLGYDGRIH